MTAPDQNSTSDADLGRGKSEASVKKNALPFKLSDIAIFGTILAIVALSFLLLDRKGTTPDEKKDQKAVIAVNEPFDAAKEPTAEPKKNLSAMPKAEPQPSVPQGPTEEEKLYAASVRAPVIIFSKTNALAGNLGVGQGTGAGASSGNPIPAGAYANPFGNGVVGGDVNELQNKLTPTRLDGIKAGYLGNRDFILAMGASLPCILETAVSSDQPGFVSCRLSRDILSDNGRVVLLDKGTLVVGEYRGALKRGQSRIFVVWNRAKTPKGVIADLGSPGSDGLGRAGFDGDIDTHFFERFGAALLLSVVSDAVANVANNSSSNQGYSNTQSAGKDAASIAVEQSINIGPTLTKNQGELVNIFVAHDVDFSNLYDLKVVERADQIVDRGHSGDFTTKKVR